MSALPVPRRTPAPEPPLPPPGITHRGHEPECRADACAPTCRRGEPWPTLRLLPEDRRRAENLRTVVAGRGAS